MSEWLVKVGGVGGTVLGDAEIKSIRWGYAFPRECILWTALLHDVGITELTNNNEIWISNDDFTTLLFRGALEVNSPQGVSQEGITYKVAGLEAMANRWVIKYNQSIDYTYNRDNLPDYHSPNLWGGRWTVGQIMVDILEHAIGVPEAGSDISSHHPTALSVTNPYMTSDTIVSYDPEALLALDLIVSEMRVTGKKFWDMLQSLVQMMDNHGIFIDPSDPDNPTLILHDYTTSTEVDFVFGYSTDGTPEHIRVVETEEGSPLCMSNQMNFDISSCRTKVIVEGRGKILELIPESQGGLQNGVMIPHWDEDSPSEVGKTWIIYESHLFTPFWEGTLSNGLEGPLLVIDGVVCHEEFANWNLESGIVTTDVDLSGSTVEVWTLFLAPFQVIAGPGGSAYDDYGMVAEIAFYDDSLIEESLPYCFKYNLISTLNPFDGVDCDSPYSQETEGEEYCMDMPPRDDTDMMQSIANAILARMGDEKINCTIQLDTIDVDAYTLLKSGNLANLEKWSNFSTQIMEITIVPEKNTMTCRLTNDVFRVPGYAEWKRRFRLRYDTDFLSRIVDRLRHPVKVGGNVQF